MKKAFISFIVFVCGLWLLQSLFDKCLSGNVNIKASYVQRKEINADVVFLGTSNTLYGIDPLVFESRSGKSMYNLATNHSSFEENLLHLYLYLKNNRKPELLVIGLSLPDLTLSGSVFHSYLFAPFFHDTCVKRLIEKNDSFYYNLCSLPFGRYAYYNKDVNPFVLKGFTHIVKHRTDAYFTKGTYYTPHDTSGFMHFRDIAELHQHRIAYEFNLQAEKELRELLSFAKSRNIPVILYEPLYWTAIDKDYTGKTEAIAKLNALADEYGSAYLRFDTLALCSQKSNFISVFHTSEKAVPVFTGIFTKTLRHTKYFREK